MPGPRSSLGGTRLPRPRSTTKSIRGRLPRPSPSRTLSSSAGPRGPARGKPAYIQERRRVKGARQGGALNATAPSPSSQPSGRGRGRQDDPQRTALAQARAQRVYGYTERAQREDIAYNKSLDRAKLGQATRELARLKREREAGDPSHLISEALGTKVPGTEYAMKAAALMLTKNASITNAVPKNERMTVAETALSAAPVPAVKVPQALKLAPKAAAAITKLGGGTSKTVKNVKTAATEAVESAVKKVPGGKRGVANWKQANRVEDAKVIRPGPRPGSAQRAAPKPSPARKAAAKRARKRLQPAGKARAKRKVKSVSRRQWKKRKSMSREGMKSLPARVALNPNAQIAATVATTGGVSGVALPYIEGAVTAKPVQTTKTTGRALVSAPAAVASIVGDVAATSGRAASAAAHRAGARGSIDPPGVDIPIAGEVDLPAVGAKAFSKEEILEPVKGQLKEQKAYLDQLYNLAAKGDAEAWKKYNEEVGGYIGPGSAALIARSATRHARGIAGAESASHKPRTHKERSKLARYRDQNPKLDLFPNPQRREAAEVIGRGQTRIERQLKDRLDNAMRASYKGKARDNPEVISFLAEERISRNPEKGVPQLEKIKQRLLANKRKPGEFKKTIPRIFHKDREAGTIADLDVINTLLDNPELLRDSDVDNAVKAFKEGYQKTRFHEEGRADYPAALEYGVTLPDEIVHPELMDITDAKTRTELEAEYKRERSELDKMGRRINEYRSHIFEAEKHPGPVSAQGARIHQLKGQLEKLLAEHDALAKASARKRDFLRAQLTPAERRGFLEAIEKQRGSKFDLKNPYERAERNDLLAQMRATKARNMAAGTATPSGRKSLSEESMLPEFEAKMKVVREKEGLEPDPGYVRHYPSDRANMASKLPVDYARVGADLRKPWTGELQRSGKVDRDFNAAVAGSIAKPFATEVQFQMVKNFIDAEHQRIPGVKSTAVDDIAVYSGKQINAAEINPEEFLMVPWADLARTARTQRGPDTLTPDKDEMSKMMKDAETTTFLELEPDRKYALIPRTKGVEFFDQLRNEQFYKYLSFINRAQSRATLGFSPAWAAWQVPAEFTQASFAVGHRVFWDRMKPSYQALTPDQQRDFDSVMGATMGTAGVPKRHGFDPNMFDNALEVVGDKTVLGRHLKRGFTGEYLGEFDKWKSGRIRSRVGRAHIDRELNGILHNAPRVFGLTKEMTSKLRGMSRDEQMEWFTSPEGKSALDEVAHYVDEMMGNWVAYTKNEKLPAALSFFYPFMRMSLRFTFWNLPKNHPFRAAVLAHMGAMNAEEVNRLLGGNVPFLASLMQAPIHTGKGGSPLLLPVNRMSMGGSALVELGLSDQPLGIGTFRLAQPAIGAAVTGTTGQDLLRQRSIVPEGATVAATGEVLQSTDDGQMVKGLQWQQQGKAAAATLQSLFFPLRFISAGRQDVPAELLAGIGGPDAEKTTGLLKVLLPTEGQSKLGTLFTPPQDPKRQRDLGKFFALLQEKQYYGRFTRSGDDTTPAQKRYAEMRIANATRKLNRMHRDYGVPIEKTTYDARTGLQRRTDTLTGKGEKNPLGSYLGGGEAASGTNPLRDYLESK